MVKNFEIFRAPPLPRGARGARWKGPPPPAPQGKFFFGGGVSRGPPIAEYPYTGVRFHRG